VVRLQIAAEQADSEHNGELPQTPQMGTASRRY
jgi:hypothetical protein